MHYEIIDTRNHVVVARTDNRIEACNVAKFRNTREHVATGCTPYRVYRNGVDIFATEKGNEMQEPITLSETDARQMIYCPCCGNEKHYGEIVCWNCFKNTHNGICGLKYYVGTLAQWLTDIRDNY